MDIDWMLTECSKWISIGYPSDKTGYPIDIHNIHRLYPVDVQCISLCLLAVLSDSNIYLKNLKVILGLIETGQSKNVKLSANYITSRNKICRIFCS